MTTDDTTRPTPAPGVEEPATVTGAHALAPVALVPSARPRALRMRTVVLGLVLLTIAVTTSIRLLTDVHLDNGVVLLVLLLVAGALLLGGGVLGAAREARSPTN